MIALRWALIIIMIIIMKIIIMIVIIIMITIIILEKYTLVNQHRRCIVYCDF